MSVDSSHRAVWKAREYSSVLNLEFLKGSLGMYCLFDAIGAQHASQL